MCEDDDGQVDMSNVMHRTKGVYDVYMPCNNNDCPSQKQDTKNCEGSFVSQWTMSKSNDSKKCWMENTYQVTQQPDPEGTSCEEVQLRDIDRIQGTNKYIIKRYLIDCNLSLSSSPMANEDSNINSSFSKSPSSNSPSSNSPSRSLNLSQSPSHTGNIANVASIDCQGSGTNWGACSLGNYNNSAQAGKFHITQKKVGNGRQCTYNGFEIPNDMMPITRPCALLAVHGTKPSNDDGLLNINISIPITVDTPLSSTSSQITSLSNIITQTLYLSPGLSAKVWTNADHHQILHGSMSNTNNIPIFTKIEVYLTSSDVTT